MVLLKPRAKSKSPTNSYATISVGILSFELANAMSRSVHLHRSLSDPQISRLFSETLTSPSIQTLVSQSPSFLLSLALFDKLDDLNRVAAAVSRLGRRHCHLPSLVGFEHIYSDLFSNRLNAAAQFLFSPKEMEAAVRKMERYVASTAALYSELEVLSDLEHSRKKYAGLDETRKVFDEKIRGQRHDVNQIREASLWNQGFDKVVLLLARAVCTIYARIRAVFGVEVVDAEAKSGEVQKSGLITNVSRFHRGIYPGKMLLNCLNLGGSGSWIGDEEKSGVVVVVDGGGGGVKVGKSGFGPKSRLTMMASSSTVGGSCLALHYANVIIIIEKFLRYPHLIGEEARDDLYQMLPSSLRLALRKSLKSYVKNLAIYDASLAHDWKEAMEKILGWLAPMAHNMIRWQTERNFEHQQIQLRESVLLVQTLYFADREKTEAAICELLVGLNYICRYEQQQNALLDCTSSADFDDCIDWQQMQFDSPRERM